MYEKHETQEYQIVEKLDELISVILDSKLRPRVQADVILWGTKDISEYIGVSYKYTCENIVSHHKFPNAIRLPTKDKRVGHPRWNAQEVIEWVQSHRES